MGRIKVVGEEKCPHIDRKTGKHDCSKLGRYNPKLMTSWNNRRRFDKLNKREYPQFIHNDGTRHNISTTTITKQEVDEHSNLDNLIQIILKKAGRYYRRIATASLTWPLKPAEREHIRAQYRAGNFQPLIDTYKHFEKLRRQTIYKHSKGLHEERYWFTESPLYEGIKDLEHIPLDKRRLEELSRLLRPETVDMIVRERWRLNRSKLLQLHDQEEYLKGLLRKMEARSNLP